MAARRESCQCARRNSSSILFIPAKLGRSICIKEQIYHEGGKCCLHPFKPCSVWSPSQPCPARGQHLLQEHREGIVNPPARVCSPEPIFPLLPSFPTAKPGSQMPGNPPAPSCSSKVCSQGAAAHLHCNRGTGSEGKCRHQILHLQPKVTMLEGRNGRGNVLHTAIQEVGFVPGSSVWQGNKVNVKTTGRHIPQ